MNRLIFSACLCFLAGNLQAQSITFRSKIIALDSVSNQPLDSVTAIITFYYLKGSQEKKTVTFNKEYSFKAKNCEFGIELKKDGYEAASYTTVEQSKGHFGKHYTFTCRMKKKKHIKLVEVK